VSRFDIEIDEKEITQIGIDAIIDFYQTIAIDKLLLPQIYAFATGVDSPFLNVVIDARPVRGDSIEEIQLCLNFFKKHQVSWTWFMVPGTALNDLENKGFTLLEEAPAMYFDLSNSLSIENMPSLTIQELGAKNDLSRWIQPINEAFDAKPEEDSYRKLNADPLNKDCTKLRHFVAMIDNNVVAAGTLFLSDQSVMLHNLATKKDYARRGIGTALTLYMMSEAKNLGYKHCFLDSSEDGFSLYKRIGFKIYSTTLIYSKE
jgi:predicted N-acetyltransferase YhbS